MEFHAPWVLWFLLLLPVLAWFQRRHRGSATIKFSSLSGIQKCPTSWRLRLRPLLGILRLLCLALVIVALARPRKGTVLAQISTEGIAIEAVVDRSSSMGAQMDYDGQKLNRLDVVKRVLADFVQGNHRQFEGRASDLIGLVVFAGFADTVCPLVLSHDVLLEMLQRTDLVNLKSEDGTAIGDAIALAAARLQKAEEEILRRRQRLGLENESDDPAQASDTFEIKSKAIILMTDGRNNAGDYHPLQAAELAQEWGIKIYTIGIGSNQAFTTVQTPLGTWQMPTQQDLDEGLLKSIAEKTGGFYGRADDADALRKIIEEIDRQEKTEVTAVQYTKFSESFNWLAFPALFVLLLEIVASCTVFRKIP
jgi:Ca-activated chloride channel family protein